jgi:hypothetical protein
MKFTFLSILLLTGKLSYSQEGIREQRIREWNEQIEQQDHLEPEQGDFVAYKYSLDYHAQIRSTLLDTLSDWPIIRMVVLPSFSPEYVISIDKIGNNFMVTKINLDSSIWYSENPEQIKRSIVTKLITDELANSFSSLYLLALSKTRYPSESLMGNDGTNYHFAAEANFATHTGTKWSPREGTRIAEMVKLTEKLMDEMSESELINAVDKLKKRM